jgi:hypothetical protein
MPWVALLIVTPLAAWGMWLLFCYAIARRYGLAALWMAAPVAKAFPLSSWIEFGRQPTERHQDQITRDSGSQTLEAPRP